MWHHNSVSRSAGHCIGLSCFVFSLSNALLVQRFIILIAANLQVWSSSDAVLNTANILFSADAYLAEFWSLEEQASHLWKSQVPTDMSRCLSVICLFLYLSPPITELGGVYWNHHHLGLVQNIFCVPFCEPFVTKLVFVGFLSLFRCRHDGMLPKACIFSVSLSVNLLWPNLFLLDFTLCSDVDMMECCPKLAFLACNFQNSVLLVWSILWLFLCVTEGCR